MEGICKCLAVTHDKRRYPKLREVRDARNASFGHPVDLNKKHSVMIIQHSLGVTGFEMLVFSDKHHFESRRISVPPMIADQRESLAVILQKVTEELRDRERRHREEFRMVRLASIIDNPNTHYSLGKICEATDKPELAPLAIAAVDEVKDRFAEVEQGLKDRGMSRNTYESISHLYEYLDYAIARLGTYFRTPEFDERMAYIIAVFVREYTGRLAKALRDIDEQYDEEP